MNQNDGGATANTFLLIAPIAGPYAGKATTPVLTLSPDSEVVTVQDGGQRG